MGAFKRKDLKMKKFECNGCVYRKCTADVEQSEIPKYCALKGYLVSVWHEVKEEEQKLPKLTAEVFDRPDCPEWANYASVNADGEVWFHARKPKIVDNFWCAGSPEKMYQRHKEFDAFDWKNSLVKRPAKEKVLPDWCKVGEWGYNTETHGYFEIVSIDDIFVNIYIHGYGPFQQSYGVIKKYCVEARKRKFNDKEMKEIVGKSLETPSFVKFIYSYDKDNGTLESHDFLYTAEDLFEDAFKFDGKPCYKLEHLNEKGEWVE
jgi:hypothetical protein